MAVKWNSAQIVDRVRRGAMRGVMIGIGIVEAHAVGLITAGGKSGRIYTRRGVKHQASAPGEAPASDTGRLVNSRRITLDSKDIRARLTFATRYALPLEVGTRRVEPRPYARRSLMEKNTDVRAAVAGEVRRELKP